MDWKAQLQGDESAISQLRDANSVANTTITRNGVEWFLETSDFEMLTDDLQVREKAQQILNAILGPAAAQPTVALGPVIRMHYDGSKTVFRAG